LILCTLPFLFSDVAQSACLGPTSTPRDPIYPVEQNGRGLYRFHYVLPEPFPVSLIALHDLLGEQSQLEWRRVIGRVTGDAGLDVQAWPLDIRFDASGVTREDSGDGCGAERLVAWQQITARVDYEGVSASETIVLGSGHLNVVGNSARVAFGNLVDPRLPIFNPKTWADRAQLVELIGSAVQVAANRDGVKPTEALDLDLIKRRLVPRLGISWNSFPNSRVQVFARLLVDGYGVDVDIHRGVVLNVLSPEVIKKSNALQMWRPTHPPP
jgi:hypothetical protein